MVMVKGGHTVWVRAAAFKASARRSVKMLSLFRSITVTSLGAPHTGMGACGSGMFMLGNGERKGSGQGTEDGLLGNKKEG